MNFFTKDIIEIFLEQMVSWKHSKSLILYEKTALNIPPNVNKSSEVQNCIGLPWIKDAIGVN